MPAKQQAHSAKVPPINRELLQQSLLDLLAIPSPTGFTDNIVHHVCAQLDELDVAYEITRRGAIRATIEGTQGEPHRAISAHLDTLGAQVKALKDNGRLAVTVIGHWSARFAEGARVTVFTDQSSYRGTLLPLKSSGHIYNHEIDTQPVGWDHLEVRVDLPLGSRQDLIDAGFEVGDIIAIDPQPEVLESGYIVSRHLDDKAGVAATLAAIRSLQESELKLPVGCHFLFTITEEVGSGASSMLHQDIAELVAVDNGTLGPGQNTSEFGVTVCMADESGPFDYHLTRHLLELCREHQLKYRRDVFKYYRCDAASAVEAGNDIRTALLAFGCDASHGYERCHLDSITTLARLLTHYALTPLTVARDKTNLGSVEGFPELLDGVTDYDRDLLNSGRR